MKTGVNGTIRGIGKVVLVLLGGILFPVLIWVALGVAIAQKMKARKVIAAPVGNGAVPLRIAPALRAESITGHCWEALHCPRERRDACPAYIRHDAPGWAATAVGSGHITDECVEGILLNLKQPAVPV